MTLRRLLPWIACLFAAGDGLCQTNSVPASTLAPIGFAGFQATGEFQERVASFTLNPEVKVTLNSPEEAEISPAKKTLLIFYMLPNGNTTEQTIGRAMKPGDDWHFDIQHIGAQTRFLRRRLRDRNIVVAYLQAEKKSWPSWRKNHGDTLIPEIVATVRKLAGGTNCELVLSGHSGGGSFIFGYLNAMPRIPDDVVRIAFLDSNYAYDSKLGHERKLTEWLRDSPEHCLSVLAYNDAAGLLNGKPFVSAAGGTWGRSHAMIQDFGASFQFTTNTLGAVERVSALSGRFEFLLKENPDHKIFHTVQVERNGFIQAMLSGTEQEGKGYEYFGDRAYGRWISAGRPGE